MPFTAPAKCAHRMPRIPCGVIASACLPMASSEVFWRSTEWFRGQVFRSARMIALLSMSRITWKAWKWRFIGTESGKRELNTTTVFHLWRSARFNREIRSGESNWFLFTHAYFEVTGLLKSCPNRHVNGSNYFFLTYFFFIFVCLFIFKVFSCKRNNNNKNSRVKRKVKRTWKAVITWRKKQLWNIWRQQTV